MTWLRSALFQIWVYGAIPFYGIAFLPWAIVSPRGAMMACRTYSIHTLWLMKHLCGCAYEVRGTPPADHAEVVVAAKHQSYVDMLILVIHVPQPRFIYKSELRWVPVLGLYAHRMGCIAVDRGKKGKAVKALTAAAAAHRGDGHQTIIFPQGTRIAPGVDAPYKVGVHRVAEALAAPTVPVATNAGVFWGKRGFVVKPGRLVATFLDPIPPGLETDAYLARLGSVIEAESDRLNEEAGFVPPAPAVTDAPA